MKRITASLLFLIAIVFMVTSCKPSKEDAINYNDKIIREQKKIVQSEKELIEAIKQDLTKGSTLETLLKELSDQIDASKKIIEEMKDFDGKSDFKDAALTFLKSYKDVCDNEYTKWLKNLKIPEDQVTEDVLYEEEELVHAINRKLDKTNTEFLNAQKDFAAIYQIKLTEN